MRRSVVAMVATAAAVAILAGCAVDPNDVNRDGIVSDYLVTFEVLGTAAVIAITYNTVIGDAEDVSDATVPWTVSEMVTEGTPVTLQARNQTDAGQVSVRLLVDGELVGSDSATEAFGQATVSGTVGDPDSF